MPERTSERPFSLFSNLDLIGQEILDLTDDCLLLIDVKTTRIVYANRASEKLYGYRHDEMCKLRFTALHRADEKTVTQELQRATRKYPGQHRIETVHVKKNGRSVPVEALIKLVVINNHRYFLSHITNITKQKRLQTTIKTLIKRLSEQATRDHLTGTYNRSHLYESYLNRLIGKESGLLLLDIRNFARINETHGHQAGDAVLAETANLLVCAAGKAGRVFRYGGDELLAVFPQLVPSALQDLRQRILAAMEELSIAHNDQTIRWSASIGIAHGVVSDRPAFDRLVREADEDLYKNKR